jgi:AAA15 family ATPase/GTPase
MLVYFKVGNFKSIKDPVVINFAATAITELHASNVIKKGKDELLKTVLLYGPNASGKSKVLDAFLRYRFLILQSAMSHSTGVIPVQPFLLNKETENQASFFESEFVLENKRYRYGFEAYNSHFKSEWLLEVKATTESPIFLRIGQDFQVNEKKFVNSGGLQTKCNENALFLTVADQWNVPLAKAIYKCFFEMYTIHGLQDDHYKYRTNELFELDEYKELINQMMQHADLGIKNVNVVKFQDQQRKRLQAEGVLSHDDNDEDNKSRVFARHNVYDKDGNVVDERSFSMNDFESEGTKKFYNIIGSVLYAIKNGYFVVIDEMDARFHTLLTKAIIRLFNSESVASGAQLLAVCHDASVMDNDLLRRDQIYIVEKNDFAATEVVNLVEYKSARKDTPLAKNYLEGKYGGIPFIENLEKFLNNGK